MIDGFEVDLKFKLNSRLIQQNGRPSAICEDSLLPLGWLDDQSGEKSISLRGRDRLRSDPQWFPSFLNCCSWMFPEQLRNKSELVGSEGTRQVRTCSVAAPGTCRNNNSENRETTGDRSSDDPCPEVRYSSHHSADLNSPEAEDYLHMVTGATGEIRQCLQMTTETQEKITYCSPGTSSGKQKKARSTNQPHIRSEKTPATKEADQILLALQQLATNSNSANFINNISRISKLPKSTTTTMPTFDGNSRKIELFEDLFQRSLKIHNQLTEDKINYFHSLMRGDALQTFKNITSPNRENLGDLTVSRRKYVKPQSMATAKHKFQRLVSNPANQKLIDFLDEVQKLAKDAFGAAAQDIIEQFIYAKMPPHLKKTINQRIRRMAHMNRLCRILKSSWI